MIDIEDESVTLVGELTTKRAGHGIGTLKINGEEKLAVFGGSDIKKHVEIYDVQTGKWEEDKNLELREAKSEFGFLTLWRNKRIHAMKALYSQSIAEKPKIFLSSTFRQQVYSTIPQGIILLTCYISFPKIYRNMRIDEEGIFLII